MHLKFLCCQETACCVMSKKRVASLHYVCSLWSGKSNWYIQSFIIALCVVLVLHHRNCIGDSISILRNHTLESLSKLASSPIFIQCIMMAHQAGLKIQESISIEVMTTTGCLVGSMNENISKMSWCVPLFCTLWIWLWCHINTWKSLNYFNWQSY